ncbi:hypothetical protein A8C75_10315 [Marinobacterium aestuarii]|uniref:Uncharacterized protein n=1 Tax=Marinobacterium aestuarii TaxID=1821621 RepID=A0A1A9EY78_9GAMM|nr:hypothetical protein [Marinobacterium aestuarii]ANG62837.1 hypothetical protein A8C75_10315 [Marinobacterium aestuarii]
MIRAGVCFKWLAVLLALIPLALLLTLLLMPLWSWLEAGLAIELVGHSGPASFCYVLVYSLLAVPAAILVWRRR